MLPLYGGAPEYMLKALQGKMNEAMRTVTRRKWYVVGQRLASTRECNYLGVRQMIYYHSVAAIHKLLAHLNNCTW